MTTRHRLGTKCSHDLFLPLLRLPEGARLLRAGLRELQDIYLLQAKDSLHNTWAFFTMILPVLHKDPHSKPTKHLKRWVGVRDQSDEVLLEPCTGFRGGLVGRSVKGVRPSFIQNKGKTTYATPQWVSYRGAEVSEVPSASPPGFTQTMASMSEDPVLRVGRMPKPAPLTLHHSPHSFRMFWRPDRPWSTMN
jgi:hypothetical protein